MLKNFFKKCNSPDFIFYLSKLTTKIFPIWCNINFGHVFFALLYIVYCNEERLKINITSYGENSIS